MPLIQIPKFVGREDLVHEGLSALQKNTHLFVRGPYGIGKTAFAKELLRRLGAPLITLSLQDPAHKMSEEFLKQVAEHKRSLRKKHARIAQDADFSSYKTLRQLKGELIKSREIIKYVIIDNVFRVSHQKLKFLRFLLDHGYKFVINIESDKYEREIFLLRSICHPQIQFLLPRLNKKESILLIEQFLKRQNRPDLASLVNQLKGYPLMIVERMKRGSMADNMTP